MSTKSPRVVVITRETEYQLLLARHGTRTQAAFFLETRGQSIEDAITRHERMEQALHQVSSTIPLDWRRNRILRGDLDRFLFEPDDTVVIVGQDGLVANVAKYLDGQPVIGINPDPVQYDGVLVRHEPAALGDLLGPAIKRSSPMESRTMVSARLGDGQSLLALNEVFVGACTHQSARYRLSFKGHQERHSSSGIIVATGTGSTGWAKSISRERRTKMKLPQPCDPRLAFFVREAFPSIATGTDVTQGALGQADRLIVISEMNEGGVIFGDGIEADHLSFDWGVTAEVSIADKHLHLVSG
jgi:NAD kinase